MSVDVMDRPKVTVLPVDADYPQAEELASVSGRTHDNPMKADHLKNGVQCRAHNKQGNRCGKLAMAGGMVCRLHGGKSPQAMRNAKLRLAALVDPSIGVLAYTLKQRGRHLPVALAAAKDVLDRNGHKPTDKIEITDTTRRLDALQQGRERARLARGEDTP